MGGRKIIQDSDDESNPEASPPPTDMAGLELSLSPIIDLQYSSPPRILEQSGETRTESSGICSRALTVWLLMLVRQCQQVAEQEMQRAVLPSLVRTINVVDQLYDVLRSSTMLLLKPLEKAIAERPPLSLNTKRRNL